MLKSRIALAALVLSFALWLTGPISSAQAAVGLQDASFVSADSYASIQPISLTYNEDEIDNGSGEDITINSDEMPSD